MTGTYGVRVTWHQFDSTEEAYDACQCDDAVKNGDVLHIPTEGVVGIADTWPCAVTVDKGDLHATRSPELGGRIPAYQIALAVAFARERGYALDPVFAE